MDHPQSAQQGVQGSHGNPPTREKDIQVTVQYSLGGDIEETIKENQKIQVLQRAAMKHFGISLSEFDQYELTIKGQLDSLSPESRAGDVLTQEMVLVLDTVDNVDQDG